MIWSPSSSAWQPRRTPVLFCGFLEQTRLSRCGSWFHTQLSAHSATLASSDIHPFILSTPVLLRTVVPWGSKLSQASAPRLKLVPLPGPPFPLSLMNMIHSSSKPQLKDHLYEVCPDTSSECAPTRHKCCPGCPPGPPGEQDQASKYSATNSRHHWDFPGGGVVKNLPPSTGTQVQFLARELRFHMPQGN